MGDLVRIASWNINSVRLRFDLLARLAQEAEPDVICLQETKVADASFPHGAVAALGYGHRLTHGQKGYHGVAILSKRPIEPLPRRDFCGRVDGRHVAVRVETADGRGLHIHTLYVPAGGDVADPDVNPKFAHKLAFLDELLGCAAHWARPRTLLLGDLNVAPLACDVWSHRQLLDVVSHTPAETERLTRIQDAGGWIDTTRHFLPPPEKVFTWWSYRASDWEASDRGRRLDHIWASPDLAPALQGTCILKSARSWPRPSDHVPLVLTLAL